MPELFPKIELKCFVLSRRKFFQANPELFLKRQYKVIRSILRHFSRKVECRFQIIMVMSPTIVYKLRQPVAHSLCQILL